MYYTLIALFHSQSMLPGMIHSAVLPQPGRSSCTSSQCSAFKFLPFAYRLRPYHWLSMLMSFTLQLMLLLRLWQSMVLQFFLRFDLLHPSLLTAKTRYVEQNPGLVAFSSILEWCIYLGHICIGTEGSVIVQESPTRT